MFAGGKVNPKNKKKASCLLTLIRYNSPDLYELICDLCLDGTFRSQKYQNTFLMPNEALVKHLEKLVEGDNELKAIDILRSLLLKGHLSKSSFKAGAQIGTLQFGSFVLADPEAVGKNVDASDKTIIATREGAFATVVLNYKSATPPATTAGKSGGNIPVGMVMGGAVNEDLKSLKEFTKDLIVEGKSQATVTNFFKAVAAALIHLEQTDKTKFNRSKFYLAANPIISWFFLTMPGRSDALISPSDLKELKLDSVFGLDIIKTAEEAGDYKLDKSLLKKIKSHRSISEHGDRGSLIGMITKAYKEMIPEALNVGAIDQILSSDHNLKMLMDEVRFMYEDAVNDWGQVDDALSALGAVKWAEPKESMVICSSETYEKHLIKGVEAFLSGPVTFVKSIYFMYVPLTKTVEEQLMKAMEDKYGGSVVGGNPANINNAVFSGGAARKKLSKSDVKLSSFVKMLSSAQRQEVLAMLQKN